MLAGLPLYAWQKWSALGKAGLPPRR
jgi:hypothetical protein